MRQAEEPQKLQAHQGLSRIEQTLADPACSNWLKDALSNARQRDPVDALNDAEHLVYLLRLQLDTLMGQYGVANTPPH